MEENYSFNRLCWVCLNEQANMTSLTDKNIKIEIEDHSPVCLYDLLHYVININIYYNNGPYLICKDCQLQAHAAYVFKKRCSLSSKIFASCGLTPCKEDEVKLSASSAETKPPSEDSNSSVLNSEYEVMEERVKIEVMENELDEDFFEENSVFEIVRDDSIPEDNHENQTVHPPKKEKRAPTVICTICGIQKSRRGINAHMLRHKNIKNHTCPFCEKRFNDKANLTVHIRIHTGVHPYVCDTCGKSFAQSTSLKTHQLIHNNVKPYKCNICTYATRTSSHLQLHLKRHNGIKNYHCSDCDYSACSKAELTYHLLKHSDEKPHVCGACGKCFARYKGLKIHEKSHTGERPHVCHLCNKGFTQAHSLRSHLRNIHKESHAIS